MSSERTPDSERVPNWLEDEGQKIAGPLPDLPDRTPDSEYGKFGEIQMPSPYPSEPLSPQRLTEIESNLRVAIEGYLGSDRALDTLLAEVERLQAEVERHVVETGYARYDLDRAEAKRDKALEALRKINRLRWRQLRGELNSDPSAFAAELDRILREALSGGEQ